MKKAVLLATGLCVWCTTLFASPFNQLQSQPDSLKGTFNKDFVLHVKKSTGAIRLDGILDESDWQSAEKADRFTRFCRLTAVLPKP